MGCSGRSRRCGSQAVALPLTGTSEIYKGGQGQQQAQEGKRRGEVG